MQISIVPLMTGPLAPCDSQLSPLSYAVRRLDSLNDSFLLSAPIRRFPDPTGRRVWSIGGWSDGSSSAINETLIAGSRYGVRDC